MRDMGMRTGYGVVLGHADEQPKPPLSPTLGKRLGWRKRHPLGRHAPFLLSKDCVKN